MEKNKTNKDTLKESLIEYKSIVDMISKNSNETIKDILSETVKKGLKNMIAEAAEDDNEPNSFEVEGGEGEGQDDVTPETGNDDVNDVNEPAIDANPEEEPDGLGADADSGMEPEIGDEPEMGEDGEDFDMDAFKTGEDEYDLTNSSIEDVVKVFKRIDNNDSVIVKKLEDGKVSLSDDETGAEYVIDLNGDSDFDFVDTEGANEFEGSDSEIGSEGDNLGEETDPMTEETEVEISLDGEEDMVDEKNMTQSIGTNRRAGRMTQTRQEYAPGKATNRDGAQLIANESKKIAAAYNAKVKQIEEAYAKKFAEVMKENAEFKNTLNLFRDKLRENAVLNNNMAKYVKIVTENATTKDEKVAILKRFSEEANTIEAGNKLFESINESLSKKGTPEIGLNIDKQFSTPKQKVNEQVIYQSQELNEMINLTKRMNRLY